MPTDPPPPNRRHRPSRRANTRPSPAPVPCERARSEPDRSRRLCQRDDAGDLDAWIARATSRVWSASTPRRPRSIRHAGRALRRVAGGGAERGLLHPLRPSQRRRRSISPATDIVQMAKPMFWLRSSHCSKTGSVLKVGAEPQIRFLMSARSAASASTDRRHHADVLCCRRALHGHGMDELSELISATRPSP